MFIVNVLFKKTHTLTIYLLRLNRSRQACLRELRSSPFPGAGLRFCQEPLLGSAGLGSQSPHADLAPSPDSVPWSKGLDLQESVGQPGKACPGSQQPQGFGRTSYNCGFRKRSGADGLLNYSPRCREMLLHQKHQMHPHIRVFPRIAPILPVGHAPGCSLLCGLSHSYKRQLELTQRTSQFTKDVLHRLKHTAVAPLL